MANTLGNTLNSLSDPAQDPAVPAENATILDLHAEFEALSHETNTSDAVHGLTNLGETFGLGRVGGDNLVTDTAQTPGDALNGATPLSEGTGLITDAGQTTSAGGLFVEGIGSTLSNPDVVQDAAIGVAGVAMNDVGSGLGNLNDVGSGLGNLNGGGEPIISAGGGAPGGSPILDAGVLNTPDNQSPVSVVAGNGQNIADVNALSNNPLDLGGNGGSGDHLISGDAGAPSANPIAQAGVLTTTDSQSPLGLDVGNGPNIASADLAPHSDALSGGNLTAPISGQDLTNGLTGGGNGGSGDHLISGDAGAPSTNPLAQTGVLTTTDSHSPVGLDVGNGQNIANADLLPNSDALSGGNLTAPIVGQDLTNGLTGGGNGGSGDHLISGDAGAPSANPLAQTGVLTTTDSHSPVGFDVGNGQNIANADLLPNSDALSGGNLTAPIVGQDLTNGLTGGGNGVGDHLVSGDAGAAGGNPIAQSGVLTTTDTQSPVGVDVANGQNLASADLLPHDALQFPDLGGAGSDSLAGLNPSASGLSNILSPPTMPSSGDPAFIDANTDGSGSPLQIHNDHSSSTLGLNDHAIV